MSRNCHRTFPERIYSGATKTKSNLVIIGDGIGQVGAGCQNPIPSYHMEIFWTCSVILGQLRDISWMFSIKFMSPVIFSVNFFPKFLASASLRNYRKIIKKFHRSPKYNAKHWATMSLFPGIWKLLSCWQHALLNSDLKLIMDIWTLKFLVSL